MNIAWNRCCRNLPSATALSLYDNRITQVIITDITGRRNVRIQNPYTCTTSSDGFLLGTGRMPHLVTPGPFPDFLGGAWGRGY